MTQALAQVLGLASQQVLCVRCACACVAAIRLHLSNTLFFSCRQPSAIGGVCLLGLTWIAFFLFDFALFGGRACVCQLAPKVYQDIQKRLAPLQQKLASSLLSQAALTHLAAFADGQLVCLSLLL